jgi:hypothetical protein
MARTKAVTNAPKATKTTKARKAGLDAAHKEALAEGRAASRAVRAYLSVIVDQRPKRGRKRTAESVSRQLQRVQESLAKGGLDPITRLGLVQERMDLTAELEALSSTVDVAEIEAGFIAHAAGYGERKGVTYNAWRELGVPPEVLRRAGIARGRS